MCSQVCAPPPASRYAYARADGHSEDQPHTLPPLSCPEAAEKMTVAPSQQRRWPRGPLNELHNAVKDGSIERTLPILSGGSIDIDQGSPDGTTPLMLAALHGHSRIARILLNKGSNVSIVDDGGFTALHISAYRGYLAVTKLLVKAGSDLEAATSLDGSTPLYLAAEKGHSEVASVLIEAGANLNSRSSLDGSTPLFVAARYAHLDALNVLIRAKADPLLTMRNSVGHPFSPLDAAAEQGLLEVVRELVRQLGIEGCGGDSGGVDALGHAARRAHLEIMAFLTSTGVVDTRSIALFAATACGRFESAKFLLRHHSGKVPGGIDAYVSARGVSGMTPVICAIGGTPCPRTVRLLADAGADATSVVQMRSQDGKQVVFNDPPIALALRCLREKSVGHEEAATEEELHKMEAVRRLLLQAEAIHASSWRWHSKSAAPIAHPAVESSPNESSDAPAAAEGQRIASIPMTLVLPTLRQRARRHGALVTPLFR